MLAEKLKFLFVFCGIGFIVLFLLWLINVNPPQQPVDDSQTPIPQQMQKTQIINDDPLRTNVKSFLAEYRTNGELANSKYRGKRIELTGVVTGVFVPSFVTSMQIEAKGGHADAFITMGGPVPQSAEQTLFLPGVSAYSEPRALFGQTQFTPTLLWLRPGITATLLCTCEQGFRTADMGAEEYSDSLDYSVQLQDCTLESIRRIPPQPDETTSQEPDYKDEATKIYSLMDKNDRNHPADGEGRNLIPPRLLHNTSLTYPVDALPAGTAGTVTVGATVEADGKLVNIHIVKSVSPALDAAALQAFSQNQFEPARNSITNAPVASDVMQNLSFTPPIQQSIRPDTEPPAPIVRQPQ